MTLRRTQGSRLAVLAFLALVTTLIAACAPPTSSSGAGDGGVATGQQTTTGARPVDVALTDTRGLDAPMAVTPFATTAPAGDVTFVVKNLGTVEHELVVLDTDTPFDKIPIADSGDPPVPVTSGADKVDEADNIGETGDPGLEAGDSRTFTVKDMKPGSYVLICNLAKHYGLGMRAAFKVTASGAATTSTTAAASAKPGTVGVALGDTKGLNAPMTVVADTATAPAGDVTFVVKNDGTVEHELIVLKTDTPFDKIPVADSGDPPVPVTAGADKVDEADNIGETGDPNLKPGDSRTFTIKDMKSGSYVLICNLARHYGLGMRTPFTVT